MDAQPGVVVGHGDDSAAVEMRKQTAEDDFHRLAQVGGGPEPIHGPNRRRSVLALPRRSASDAKRNGDGDCESPEPEGQKHNRWNYSVPWTMTQADSAEFFGQHCRAAALKGQYFSGAAASWRGSDSTPRWPSGTLPGPDPTRKGT